MTWASSMAASQGGVDRICSVIVAGSSGPAPNKTLGKRVPVGVALGLGSGGGVGKDGVGDEFDQVAVELLGVDDPAEAS